MPTYSTAPPDPEREPLAPDLYPPPPTVSRDKLLRMRILTPLSVLLSLGANLVCALAIRPGLGDINKDYYTHLTPSNSMLAMYWIVLYSLHIGFCFLVVAGRKEETKDAVVNGVGMRFIIAHWVQAIWAIFWTVRVFWGSVACLSLNALLLLTIYLTLIRHKPSRSRPLDYIFIHAPVRMWLVVLVAIDIQHAVFVALDWLSDRATGYPHHQWPAFGLILGPAALGAVFILLNKDFIWLIAHLWIVIAVFIRRPKPFPVMLACIASFVILPGALVVRLAWDWWRSNRRQGRIRLEEEARERAGYVDREEERIRRGGRD